MAEFLNIKKLIAILIRGVFFAFDMSEKLVQFQKLEDTFYACLFFKEMTLVNTTE